MSIGDIKEIKIGYTMVFASKSYDFMSFPKFSNSFTIDCVNNKIISDKDYLKCTEKYSDCELYQKAIPNILKNELEVDCGSLKKFLTKFNKLELKETIIEGFPMSGNFYNFIEIRYQSDKYMRKFLIYDDWGKLGEYLIDLVGFDILNLKLSKYVITRKDYMFKKDGVYEKETSKRLKLKSLKLGIGIMGNNPMWPRMSIDFENNLIDLKPVEDEKLNTVLDLLEKYHIYELEERKYWQKIHEHHHWVMDGRSWILDLIFEDDRHWMIGDYGSRFPDVYIHLAKEIIDLTGIDILGLSNFSEDDLKLYEEYGDRILGI